MAGTLRDRPAALEDAAVTAVTKPLSDGASRAATNSGGPAAPVRLSDAIAGHPCHVVRVPFDATLGGRSVTVTAVLGRTAVYSTGGVKELALHAEVLVDEAALAWIALRDNDPKLSGARGRRLSYAEQLRRRRARRAS